MSFHKKLLVGFFCSAFLMNAYSSSCLTDKEKLGYCFLFNSVGLIGHGLTIRLSEHMNCFSYGRVAKNIVKGLHVGYGVLNVIGIACLFSKSKKQEEAQEQPKIIGKKKKDNDKKLEASMKKKKPLVERRKKKKMRERLRRFFGGRNKECLPVCE